MEKIDKKWALSVNELILLIRCWTQYNLLLLVWLWKLSIDQNGCSLLAQHETTTTETQQIFTVLIKSITALIIFCSKSVNQRNCNSRIVEQNVQHASQNINPREVSCNTLYFQSTGETSILSWCIDSSVNQTCQLGFYWTVFGCNFMQQFEAPVFRRI